MKLSWIARPVAGIVVLAILVLPTLAQDVAPQPQPAAETTNPLPPPPSATPKPPDAAAPAPRETTAGTVPLYAEVLVIKRDWTMASEPEQANREFQAALADAPVPERMRKEPLRHGPEILFSTPSVYPAEHYESLAAWLRRHGLLVERALGDRAVMVETNNPAEVASLKTSIRIPLAHLIPDRKFTFEDRPLVESQFECVWEAARFVDSNDFRASCEIHQLSKALGAQEFTRSVFNQARIGLRNVTIAEGQVLLVPSMATNAMSSRGEFTSISFYDTLLVIHSTTNWPPPMLTATAAIRLPERILSGTQLARYEFGAPRSPSNYANSSRSAAGGPRSASRAGTGTTSSGSTGLPARELAVYTLQHVKADDAAGLLRQLFGDSLNLALTPGLNEVAVSAGPDVQRQIQPLLERIDRPGASSADDARAPTRLDSPRAASTDPTTSTPKLSAETRDRELQSLELARRVRELHATGPTEDSGELTRARQRLRQAIAEAFDARQRLVAVQAAELEKRLAEIRHTYELRQRAREQIIERRWEELQRNDLSWDADEPGSSVPPRNRASGAGVTGAAADNSAAQTRSTSRIADNGFSPAADTAPGATPVDAESTGVMRSASNYYKALTDARSRVQGEKRNLEQLAAGRDQPPTAGKRGGRARTPEELTQEITRAEQLLARYERDRDFLEREYAAQLKLLEGRFMQAELKAKQAHDDLSRVKSLAEKKVVPDAEVRQAERVYQAAQASVDSVRVLLDLYHKAGTP